MVNNNIRRFFFCEDKDKCPKNFPGLIDAIYLAFMFNPDSTVSNTEKLLEILRGVSAENYASVGDALKLKSEGIHNYSESGTDKYDPIEDGECAHLSYSGDALGGNGGYMLRVPIDGDKSSFSCKSQGEQYGITYLSELNVVLKERSVKVSELQHALLHTPLKIGVFFRDANGDTRLMCDPDYPLKLEISDESGEGPSGSASASIKFSQVSKIPPIYYRSKLQYSSSYGSNLSNGRDYILCDSGHMTIEEGVKP